MAELSTFIGQIPLTAVLYAVAAILPVWYLGSYLLSPLGKFPGPFLAGKFRDQLKIPLQVSWPAVLVSDIVLI